MGWEGESQTGWGREFQSRGAVREKALSPKVLSLDRRTVRVRVEEDLRVRNTFKFIIFGFVTQEIIPEHCRG